MKKLIYGCIILLLAASCTTTKHFSYYTYYVRNSQNKWTPIGAAPNIKPSKVFDITNERYRDLDSKVWQPITQDTIVLFRRSYSAIK